MVVGKLGYRRLCHVVYAAVADIDEAPADALAKKDGDKSRTHSGKILGVVGCGPHGAVGKHRSAFERAAQRSGGGKPVALIVPMYAERIAHCFNKNVARGPGGGSTAGMTAHAVADNAKRCRAECIYAVAVLIFNPF